MQYISRVRFFRAFSSVVRQMPEQNPQRRGTARTLPNFCVVLCILCFVTYSVLFVRICLLNYCHRVATQLQLNISYHIGILICVCVCVKMNAYWVRNNNLINSDRNHRIKLLDNFSSSRA